MNNNSNNPISSNNTNFTGTTNGINNYSSTLPPAFYGHNNNSPTDNNIFPTHPTPVASDNNNVYHHQQPLPSNPSTSQYSQYIDQTPLQSALPLINSLTVTINSPQTNIIFTQASSDILSQLRQSHNHSSPTDNSQTQFQQ